MVVSRKEEVVRRSVDDVLQACIMAVPTAEDMVLVEDVPVHLRIVATSRQEIIVKGTGIATMSVVNLTASVFALRMIVNAIVIHSVRKEKNVMNARAKMKEILGSTEMIDRHGMEEGLSEIVVIIVVRLCALRRSRVRRLVVHQ